MPSKSFTVSYAPNIRAVPSLASSWAPLSERIHSLHNSTAADTSGSLTDQQNVAIRTALIEAFRIIGGEDKAVETGQSVFASFSVSASAVTIFLNRT
jgi:hypothetical protein